MVVTLNRTSYTDTFYFSEPLTRYQSIRLIQKPVYVYICARICLFVCLIIHIYKCRYVASVITTLFLKGFRTWSECLKNKTDTLMQFGITREKEMAWDKTVITTIIILRVVGQQKRWDTRVTFKVHGVFTLNTVLNSASQKSKDYVLFFLSTIIKSP